MRKLGAPPPHCVSVARLTVDLLQLGSSVSDCFHEVLTETYFVCWELVEFKMTCSHVVQTAGS